MTAGKRFVTTFTVIALVLTIALFAAFFIVGIDVRAGHFSIPLVAGVVVLAIGLIGLQAWNRSLSSGVRYVPY